MDTATIRNEIRARPPETIVDFMSLDKRIDKGVDKERSALKIAILCSFTVRGLKEVLNVKCAEAGISADFFVSDYNRYAEEILNDGSGLYAFKPSLAVLFIDTEGLMGEYFYSSYKTSADGRRRLIEEKVSEVRALTGAILAKGGAKVIVHNLQVPAASPLGVMEQRSEFGFIDSIREFNRCLKQAFREEARVFVLDYELFCSRHGKANIIDRKMYYLADMKLRFDYMPQLCDEYMGYILPLMSMSRKCLVLDLDNTLWGGVLGEDGPGGIRLGPYPEGRPFWEFQKYILGLHERGVILALNSRNNSDEVMAVLREHPHMVLKEGHFAALRINWKDKAENLKEIAGEINIGLDSLVFIDDDSVNREYVKECLPEVEVLDMPHDAAEYTVYLERVNCFNTLSLTDEDKHRGRMYVQERQRRQFKSSRVDFRDFLKGLNMVMTVSRACELNMPRISQLTQRTNQFNTTTRRYSTDELKLLTQRAGTSVYCIKVEDKFGDNGICGAVIIEGIEDGWEIGSFLLSCRVLGRRVEDALLSYFVRMAGKKGVKTVRARFIPTAKNAPAKDLYRNNGFGLMEDDKDGELWQRPVHEEDTGAFDFITVNEEAHA